MPGTQQVKIRKTVYGNLVEIIKSRIISGEYQYRTLLPREVDLSVEFNVSRKTLRKALGILEQDGWLLRKKRVGTYVLNPLDHSYIHVIFSSSPEAKSSQSDYNLHVRLGLFQGIIERAAKYNIQIIPHIIPPYQKLSSKTIKSLVDYNDFCNGIIFSSFGGYEELIETLHAHRKPYVIARSLMCKYNCIIADYEYGVKLAFDQFIADGHSRIGMLVPYELNSPFRQIRLNAYKKLTKKYSLEEDLIYKADINNDTNDVIDEITNSTNAPSAILAANDWLAINLLKEASKAGINVPEDLSIIGFDNIPQSQMTNPPLTTVETKRVEAGRAAVDMLVKLANEQPAGAINKTIRPELAVRKTTLNIQTTNKKDNLVEFYA